MKNQYIGTYKVVKIYRVSPRIQQIKFDKNGESFVTFHGKKHLLCDFMRFNKPMTYVNKGKETTFHGYKVLGNSYGLLINISNCGESAIVTLNY